ncbi:ATP-binding protein [Sphingomonas sp. YL-JM2C]
MSKSLLRPVRGPTLVVQIVMLLLGGLVVAQVVTLLLTLLLPPAPTPQYHLDAVAAVLKGRRADGNLRRIVQSGPPDLGGRGWLTSERSRRDLAQLLDADPADVRLSFYTPLPFAGTVAARKLAMATDGPVAPREAWLRLSAGRTEQGSGAGLILAQATVPRLPTTGTGDLVLPDGRPLPPAARPPNRDMLPPEARPERNRPHRTGGGLPSGGSWRNPDAGSLIEIDPTPVQGRDGIWIGGDRGETIPPILGGPQAATDPRRPGREGGASTGRGNDGGNGSTPATGTGNGTVNPPLIEGFPRNQQFQRPTILTAPAAPILPSEILRPQQTAPLQQPSSAPVIDVQRMPTPLLRGAPSIAAPVAPQPAPIIVRPGAMEAPAVVPDDAASAAPTVADEAPVPIVPRERGLFGLAPAPFVEGDFIAAMRLHDGRWSVVQPAPEPFPNSWQRRVLLWFLMAFAIVAPLGWLFARRMSKPLVAFAEAAEQLGRDPTAPVLDLDGPAEVGRAAHAFNLMQSRLKSFVGDRTAMIGAISHDLRTPLTRLRFRIEEVEDETIRDGMIGEVEEMEEMINSVLAFIRDASSPGVRERIDLRTIVEDVAEDAAVVGNEIRIEPMVSAPVDVDVMGMRRLFANLFENAAKYGERAKVCLSISDGEAIAEVLDEGPGIPDEDLERAFEPFYRSSNAHASDKRGSGLGLAVCRSIARAHGGDVRLRRLQAGFAAEVRIPLAYQAADGT